MRFTLLTLAFLLFFGMSSFCQTQMTSQEIALFKQQVKSRTRQISSVTSDFTETKYISVLTSPSKSSGVLKYKANKLLWQYDAPRKSAMLFIGDRLTLKNDQGRTTNIDLNKNKRFRQLQQLMIGSYTGDLFEESAFNISFYKKENKRLAIMTPRSNMSKHIKEVTLTFENNEYTVSEIKIVESSDDYSIIELKNKKLNSTLNDNDFSL